MNDNLLKILDRLRNQCSRREYCSSDVYKKALKAFDGDETLSNEVLGSLIKDKYVDDLRYASAYAREKSTISGWGCQKIRYALSLKKIPSEIISKALSSIDDNKAEERLMRLIANKSRSLAGDPQRKIKILRFLLGRGYSYEECKGKIEKI